MIVKTPWSQEFVDMLNKRQACTEPFKAVHPYTCGNCRAVLVAKVDGWHCPNCNYRQDWAHTIEGGNK